MTAEYSEHFVAFLDILGYKDLLETASCDEIVNIVNGLEKIKNLSKEYCGVPIEAYEHLNYKILSDKIVLFIDASINDSFPVLIDVCRRFQTSLANRIKPVLLRGGITKGAVYYDDNAIFGDAPTQQYWLNAIRQ